MACTNIPRGGGFGRANHSVHRLISRQNARLPSSLMLADPHRRLPSLKRIAISAINMPQPPAKLQRRPQHQTRSQANDSVAARQKLDQWMRNSVVDIIKNLREAPLFVQVYPEGNGTVITRTEKAEDWALVKAKWDNGGAQLPEGVIFVEQLKDDGDDHHNRHDEKDGVTRAWGIVVQGRAVESGPACYLLKTSRVGVGSGVGMWCTHFCLVRVKNFWESAKSQLQKPWLSPGGL